MERSVVPPWWEEELYWQNVSEGADPFELWSCVPCIICGEPVHVAGMDPEEVREGICQGNCFIILRKRALEGHARRERPETWESGDP